jgi:hypothetical protein
MTSNIFERARSGRFKSWFAEFATNLAGSQFGQRTILVRSQIASGLGSGREQNRKIKTGLHRT